MPAQANYFDQFDSTPSAPNYFDQFDAPKGSPVPQAPPKAAPPAPAPNTYSDIIKSAATGLAKGGAAIVGLPGDIANTASDAVQWAGKQAGVPDAVMNYKIPGTVEARMPGSDSANNAIQSVVGQYHVPETTAGRYAQTIAEFAPAALAPGGFTARAIRTALPAVTSETAGELTQGTPLETPARIAGGLVGGFAAPGAIRSINALSSTGAIPSIIDPAVTAGAKVRAAVNADGGPSAVGSNIVDWQGSGASGPALVDVGGNNVRRLIRAAAAGGSGEAQNVATDYAGRIRANFQDNVLDHTNALTPTNDSSAITLGEQLDKGQREVADTKYPGPYAEPATVTPKMVDALQGPEGRGAISQALLDASANRNTQQMGELQDLKTVASQQAAGPDPITGRFRTLSDALSGLSAGSLDRVRIAMRDTGRDFAAAGRNSRAGGYFDRVNDIDTALDQTPGLQPARAEYSQMQAGRDAVDVGGGIISTPANDYANAISGLAAKGGPPNIGLPLQVGARQALVSKLETGADGATGPAKTISQSSRLTQNLGNTFGDTKAAQYQAAIGNEVKRVGNGDFISPNTGSQTALRGDDQGLVATAVANMPTSVHGFLATVIDHLRGRGTTGLTDAERTAIVRMGTTEADLRLLAKRNPQMSSAAIAQIAAGNSSQQQ